MNFKIQPYFLSICVIAFFYLVLSIGSLHHAFFYDTIQLGASHAWFFYETNFTTLLLPNPIDSGHFPIFGFYLAIIWKLFGVSLAISHLAMLPFLILTFYYSYKILLHFLPKENLLWAFPILLLEPTYVAQSSLISPDVALISFFLMSLYYILISNRLLIILSSILLGAISMRGMMTCVGLYFFDLFLNFYYGKKTFKQLIIHGSVYIPTALIFIAFHLYHYAGKGWIGFHADSEWAQCFAPTTLKEKIKNVGIMFWRMIDFGRIFLYFSFLVIIGTFFKKFLYNRPLRILFFLTLFILFVLCISPIVYKNLNNHRYLLPIYFSFSLLTIYCIHLHFKTINSKILISIFICAGLISGHLWKYPQGIAVGWDGTLAHFPIYEMKNDFLKFIEKENIDKNKISTFFPLRSNEKNASLIQNDTLTFANMHHDQKEYILYSNICNDFNDEQIKNIKESEYLYYQKNNHIELILVKNKNHAIQ